MKIIDLSVSLKETSKGPERIKVEKVFHKPGAKIISKKVLFLGKKSIISKIKVLAMYLLGKWPITPECFPDEEFLSNEFVTLSTHSGTHIDAPWHYGSTCEGKKSKTADEIPLELCYGNGVVLDLTFKKDNSLISCDDIKQALSKINYNLNPTDIVFIMTGYDKRAGTASYFLDHPGMTVDATKYLIDNGIKVMGIDTFGFDKSFKSMISDYINTRDKNYLWPCHFFGRQTEYYHIERLANLDKIPVPFGFKVALFPVKICDVGAAWIRAVAIIE